MSGMDILENLMEGNRRFVEGKAVHSNQGTARRKEIAQKQRPVAAVVACADSRVTPEILFDQGLGDLFVLRVAGNVVNEMFLGSLEYAVEVLGVSLVVVIGHKRCGAVDAAVKGGDAPGHIGYLVRAITPSVEKIRELTGDPVENAVRENVRDTVDKIKQAKPILNGKVEAGALSVVGAYFDLDAGTMEIL